MKRLLLTLIALAALPVLAGFPIKNGKLQTDMDAQGHTIKNLDFGPMVSNETFKVAVTNATGGMSSGGTGQPGIVEEHDPLFGEWQTANEAKVLEKVIGGDGLIAQPPAPGSPFATQKVRVDAQYVKGLAKDVVSAWTNANIIVSNEVLEVQVNTTNGYESVWKSSTLNQGEIAQLKAQAAALLARVEALENGGGASVWNSFAADGSPNPDPEYMTYLNRPATVFGSGFSWETSGSYAVLCQSGSVAFAAGADGGEFRIGPNSTNYFGYAMGGTMIVGANCKSIDASTAGNPGGVVSMKYPYTGGDFPVLWYSPDLAIDFTEQPAPVWVDNLDGTATVTVPAETTKGFWYATTSATISSVFKTTMPARFDGGVIGGTNDLPVVYDSVITIQSGGRNYLVPAQEVR